jgi:hypothetical protein
LWSKLSTRTRQVASEGRQQAWWLVVTVRLPVAWRYRVQGVAGMSKCVLMLIVASELEQTARKVAEDKGFEALSLIHGRGVSSRELPGFFGITAEGKQSILLYLLDTDRGLQLLDHLVRQLRLDDHARGVACCIAVEYLLGDDL